MWTNDLGLCVPSGQLTRSSAEAAVRRSAPANAAVHGPMLWPPLDITWCLCWHHVCRRVTEKGSLCSGVSSEPKYTEDTLALAFIPVNFIWLCDFALSLCYHSGGRSQKQVTWASLKQIKLLFDGCRPTKNASLTIQETIPSFHYYSHFKPINLSKSCI